jgi:hypothetical protein
MTATISALAPPMNHVFVDFENVHQLELSLIGAKTVSFTLMVGEKQTKLAADLVEKLLEHSASIQVVKLKSSKKNSLDFALAYYLGRAALADPTAHFHLIARDGGYDPLIEHLRERHINVRRYASCADLTFSWPGKAAPVSQPPAKEVAVKKVAKKAPKKAISKKAAVKEAANEEKILEERVKRVVKNFKEHPKERPAKKKTLRTKIGNLIGKTAESSDVQLVIAILCKAGYLTFDEKGIPIYQL